MRNKVALTAGLICAFGVSEARAACHKFTIWNFPWRQSCPAFHRMTALAPLPAPVLFKRAPAPREPEFPLPDLNFVPCDPAPEMMAGRLILKATLQGATNGR